MKDFVSPYLERPLRSLEEARRDIEASRAQSDVDEALEDLSPLDMPKVTPFILPCTAMVFFGVALGHLIGGA